MTAIPGDLEAAMQATPLPRDHDGPVFDAPWQAQAFAMAVHLSRTGHFTWTEWAGIFGAEIAAATREGRGCGNNDYYLCWLAALEKLVTDKQILSVAQLQNRKREWHQASLDTPHGSPIELLAREP
jgi:nitrile hydratase accessory protein